MPVSIATPYVLSDDELDAVTCSSPGALAPPVQPYSSMIALAFVEGTPVDVLVLAKIELYQGSG